MSKKMILGIALIVMTILACTPKYNAEEDFEAEPNLGGKGVTITGYSGDKWEINIPPKIQKIPVTEIGFGAFANNQVISVTIPNSVTSIGDRAFYGCASLSRVTIPKTVTSIGYGAFGGCASLNNLTIPNSVISITIDKITLTQVSNVSSVNPSLNGKPILAYAFTDTQDVLTDELFGVSERAIVLSRNVEYYQYRENTSTETDGWTTTTTYTYPQEWVSKPINSNTFADPLIKGRNVVLMLIENKTEQAADVSFGAYKLPPFIISSIRGTSQSTLEPVNVSLSEEEIIKKMSALGRDVDREMVYVQKNVVYFGKSPSTPSIGDVRITFTKTMSTGISIIAKVVDNTFDRIVFPGDRAIPMVSMGVFGVESLITSD
jgi:hypothetical protein